MPASSPSFQRVKQTSVALEWSTQWIYTFAQTPALFLHWVRRRAGRVIYTVDRFVCSCRVRLLPLLCVCRRVVTWLSGTTEQRWDARAPCGVNLLQLTKTLPVVICVKSSTGNTIHSHKLIEYCTKENNELHKRQTEEKQRHMTPAQESLEFFQWPTFISLTVYLVLKKWYRYIPSNDIIEKEENSVK